MLWLNWLHVSYNPTLVSIIFMLVFELSIFLQDSPHPDHNQLWQRSHPRCCNGGWDDTTSILKSVVATPRQTRALSSAIGSKTRLEVCSCCSRTNPWWSHQMLPNTLFVVLLADSTTTHGGWAKGNEGGYSIVDDPQGERVKHRAVLQPMWFASHKGGRD